MMRLRISSYFLLAGSVALLTLAGCAGDPDAPPEIRRFTPEEMDQILDELVEVRMQARIYSEEHYPDLNDLGDPIPNNNIRRRNSFLDLANKGRAEIGEKWGLSFSEFAIMVEYRGGLGQIEEQYELDRLVGI